LPVESLFRLCRIGKRCYVKLYIMPLIATSELCKVKMRRME
jgi:hypothetical protein